MFIVTELLINPVNKPDIGVEQAEFTEDGRIEEKTKEGPNNKNNIINKDSLAASDLTPTDGVVGQYIIEKAAAGFASDTTTDILAQEPWPNLYEAGSVESTTAKEAQLIFDSTQVDYQTYIPKMQYDSELLAALDISCPDIDIDAEAAILFNASTKEVLYCKNPVQAVFPASTIKLLTAMVALNWCSEEEEVTVGDEIEMIASDSTTADLKQGQRLTLRCLLEGMLLPSGNDAAYVAAAYVGRKSLNNPSAPKEQAVVEFVELMNKMAREIGVKNSCFKTPDGYDAIGQYTTAYDMGLIGMEALNYAIIVEISHKSKAQNIFLSGEDVTWTNTNKLVTRYSGKYYSLALGLKTGTSTMAGRCLVSAGIKDGKKVVCVIMDSTSAGRWDDSITLLKYGLE